MLIFFFFLWSYEMLVLRNACYKYIYPTDVIKWDASEFIPMVENSAVQVCPQMKRTESAAS